jgi:hypothetical protein
MQKKGSDDGYGNVGKLRELLIELNPRWVLRVLSMREIYIIDEDMETIIGMYNLIEDKITLNEKAKASV